MSTLGTGKVPAKLWFRSMPSVPPPSTSCANVPVSGYVSTKFSTAILKESSNSKYHSALYCSLAQTPGYPGCSMGCTKFARYSYVFIAAEGTVAIF